MSFGSTIVATLSLAALVTALFLVFSRSSALFHYRRAGPLFTPSEKVFYRALCRAVGDDFLVFGKVRVADLVTVQGMKSARTTTALNRIAAKHVDFVLCTRAGLSPVCAIELNDKSHQRADRKSRDGFLKAVFAHVGMPLVWVSASRGYDTSLLRQQIAAAIDGSKEANPSC